MIQFQEHTETGYALRTWENAKRADLTIAFAIDFHTPGELLTRKAAYGKYYSIEIKDFFKTGYSEQIQKLIKILHSKKVSKLNIAGNGIYTLKYYFKQEEVDAFILQFLNALIYFYEENYGDSNFSVRSGGQTGVDEAALKAGDKLGLETICLAPKHWMFRNEKGIDISDETAFLSRFGEEYLIGDLL